MRRRPTRAWAVVGAGTTLAVMAALGPVTQATAAPDDRPVDGQPGQLSQDTRELTPKERSKAGPLDLEASRAAQRKARAEGRLGKVGLGDQKTWLGYDEVNGDYLKRYQLRGIGDNIQVWVANDRAFPLNDCRTDLGLTDVTQPQINRFIREFSSNIYPVESKAFSTPPTRNGAEARTDLLGLPDGYFRVGKKQADDIVVLVDNVRDPNFYDPTTPDGQTFIAGFFSSTYNLYTDRNIMSIDVYDWLHRTGANPPDDTADPAYQACAAALGGSGALGAPRPNNYEGVFAHEYQHLLESYEDADEEDWVDEGLADWAQTLTGYVNPRVRTSKPGADSHLACFGGYLPPSFGGPENSLTEWEDQGGPEVLCDYGAAYSFMEYLHSHYGDGFMRRLHRSNLNGLDGLRRVLHKERVKASPQRVLDRWAAMVAIDARVDGNGGRLVGARAGAFTARTLHSVVNWSTEEAYGDPGAPANGSDYVRLRDGDSLSAGDIESITFTGDTELAPAEVEWTEDATPPDAVDADTTCGAVDDGTGPTALHSGCGNNLDRSIVQEVAVPAGSPELTFDALWDIEQDWDFGFVQVSADGGESWSSLPTGSTTFEHDPNARAGIVAQLPGFSGESAGWESQTADLSAYAGQTVLLGFRYMTDGAAAEAGLFVRDVAVDGVAVPSGIGAWQTETQANPPDVDGWTVQLVAYAGGKDPVHYHQLAVDPATFTGELTGDAVRDAIGDSSSVVAAIITQRDPDEDATGQAGYRLRVNGVTQPGGAPLVP